MEGKNDSILNRAKVLAQLYDSDDLHAVTLLILYDLGMPLNCSGFDYLKNIIPIAAERPSQIILTEIFAEAEDCYDLKCGYNAMDSAVRDVIKKAWADRLYNDWNCYIPNHILRRSKPPSNVEFIAAMAYFLERWQGCCKGDAYAKHK